MCKSCELVSNGPITSHLGCLTPRHILHLPHTKICHILRLPHISSHKSVAFNWTVNHSPPEYYKTHSLPTASDNDALSPNRVSCAVLSPRRLPLTSCHPTTSTTIASPSLFRRRRVWRAQHDGRSGLWRLCSTTWTLHLIGMYGALQGCKRWAVRAAQCGIECTGQTG